MFQKYLMHDRLPVRFGLLLGVVLIVFLLAWTLSYLFLPEGVLLGKTAAQALAGNDLAGGSVYLEWLRILALNIGMMGLFVAANLFRATGNVPLGYVAVAGNALMFGAIIGTNSFPLSQGGKLPPSLGILGSSGLYEIAAYVLAAAATISISKYRLIGKWGEKMSLPKIPSVIHERNVGVLLAIAILVFACGWEAIRVALAFV
ncbi:MAG: hypothetical protein M1281_15475 [Chloroflexi bacterium]|nr:hypothetical protein [Chloroflexota bacterium]